jgi:4'-phosphopantetheinyl transferase
MSSLPLDEIHIWMMRITDNRGLLDGLTTAEEQEQAETMRSEKRRCEWLSGRALLRDSLACYTGADPLSLSFKKTASGKPFIDLPDAPAFNMSHGQEWLVCALARADNLGVDVDSHLRRNRTNEIADRYFNPHEQAVLARAADDRTRQQLFFSFWTLKEAYIKALGETINSVRLHDIAFDLDNAAPHARFALPSGYWQFYHRQFDRHHHLALACQRAECDTANLRFWVWDAATQTRREYTEETLC